MPRMLKDIQVFVVRTTIKKDEADASSLHVVCKI